MFTLPELPHDFNAYEPYIDAKTMELHYTKHHQAYLDKFNKAIAGTEMEDEKTVMSVITNISKTNDIIRNNAGGYHNHNLFWSMLTLPKGQEPEKITARAIEKHYGDFTSFKAEFAKFALNSFGSGWVWLCRNKVNELFICTTPNQDNPSMDIIDEQKRGIPILGLDLWEHAYYLQYQNRRAEYIECFWNIVNWETVDDRLQYASF